MPEKKIELPDFKAFGTIYGVSKQNYTLLANYRVNGGPGARFGLFTDTKQESFFNYKIYDFLYNKIEILK